MTKKQIEAFKNIVPGPWRADWDDNGQWYVEPLGLTGTRLRGDSGDCIESATATAIAALPDLLQEREEMITALGHALARNHEFTENCDGCARLRAILVKASGEGTEGA